MKFNFGFKKHIAVDVFECLNNLKIPYREDGDDYVIRCISGSHKDNRPSLHIDKEKGIFKCWSCGYKGNMITLVGKVLGVSHSVAVSKLSETNKLSGDVGMEALKFKKEIDVKVVEVAKKIKMPAEFLKINATHQMFLEYLYHRGVTWAMIQKFDIRCCLIGYYNYRIVIPIYCGKLVSYIARDILTKEERFEIGEKKFKKILYPKGTHVGNYLFNQAELNFDETLYLVEGVFDFFSLWRQGFKNSTCIFGLHITDKQLINLKRFKRITVIPDQDGYGKQTLTDIAFKKLSQYCKISEVLIPAGKDPGDVNNLGDYICQSRTITPVARTILCNEMCCEKRALIN